MKSAILWSAVLALGGAAYGADMTQNSASDQQRQSDQQNQSSQTTRWLYFDTLSGPDYLMSITTPSDQSQNPQQQNDQPASNQQANSQQKSNQQNYGESNSQNERGQRGLPLRQPADEQMQLHGTVQRARLIQFRGVADKHVVAEVKLDNGRTVTIDLGPQQSLGDQRLQKGQELSINGRVGTIADQLAVFAEQVSTNGHRYTIDRSDAENAGQMAQQSQQREQQRFIRGTINEAKDIRLRGLNGQFVLATIDCGQNKPNVTVNLGPKSELSDLNLSSGQRVSVTGEPGHIGGSPVIFATRVRTGGESIPIDWHHREDMNNAQPQQAASRQNPEKNSGSIQPGVLQAQPQNLQKFKQFEEQQSSQQTSPQQQRSQQNPSADENDQSQQ